ncbi:hypothetical protein M378DRAFT_171636 [Amanita muscaria Koide BX008]|uniref:Uncharacterized protein n=1 Tax=Amanita muscaria (strain Koide BX008) TaxID=946122 RepID=A0A0C2SU61_AMAMK|nr:hypothetical protein M378DRAFT_171636 [Amanita muscaria Koide BX008]
MSDSLSLESMIRKWKSSTSLFNRSTGKSLPGSPSYLKMPKRIQRKIPIRSLCYSVHRYGFSKSSHYRVTHLNR